MPVYTGTYYSRVFAFKQGNGSALDISGWDFAAEVRVNVSDADPALTLTSLPSPSPPHFTVIDGANGKLLMELFEDDTESLTPQKYIFDVMRIDMTSGKGPQFLFSGTFTVKQPVTRSFES